tara:strand:- start:805 stop:1236 length:432 start_codon:yes stop_codon:yes gene_type:complete
LKKKISSKDKKDWLNFVESNEKIYDKDNNLIKKKIKYKKKTIDLHGYSLNNANKVVKDFINNCYDNNISEINIITGKGSRSNVVLDPYLSKDLSILKYSVPSYIVSDNELMDKIKDISFSDIESPIKGSFVILLKKKLKNKLR